MSITVTENDWKDGTVDLNQRNFLFKGTIKIITNSYYKLYTC